MKKLPEDQSNDVWRAPYLSALYNYPHSEKNSVR